MEDEFSRDQEAPQEVGGAKVTFSSEVLGKAVIANARTGHKPKKLVEPTYLPGSHKRHTRLLIPATIQVGNDPEKSVNLVVDTGSEVDLIRAGVVASNKFVPARRPLQLWAANSGQLAGGQMEVAVNIKISVVDCDSKKKITITTPTYL